MSSSVTGDIAIAVLRRQGIIAVPVYLWDGTNWVDFATLTAGQFSAWVDLRSSELVNDPNNPASAYTSKEANKTISRTNTW